MHERTSSLMAMVAAGVVAATALVAPSVTDRGFANDDHVIVDVNPDDEGTLLRSRRQTCGACFRRAIR